LEEAEEVPHGQLFEMAPEDILSYAHSGYIYSLCIAQRSEGSVLLSASGDGECRVWQIEESPKQAGLSLSLLKTLAGDDDQAVLSITACNNTLFAGYQGGLVR